MPKGSAMPASKNINILAYEIRFEIKAATTSLRSSFARTSCVCPSWSSPCCSCSDNNCRGILSNITRREVGEYLPVFGIEATDNSGRVRIGFNADRLIPKFLRGLVLGAYVADERAHALRHVVRKGEQLSQESSPFARRRSLIEEDAVAEVTNEATTMADVDATRQCH